MPIDSQPSHQVLLSLPEVEVEAISIDNRQFLLFEFRNHFSTKAAEAAAACWTTYNQEHQQSAIHIWNCKRMSGFDMAAKKVWMAKMKASGSLMERIILISEMILIRGAARLMSKFSKHLLDVYRSVEEMEKKEGFILSKSLEQT